MDVGILETILSVLLTALITTVVFRQLRLPLILGYLAVGVMMGPHALGLIHNTEIITLLAEFGVVFLMFTVGLEFSQPKLFALRKAVFLIGGLQVLLCTFITTMIGMALGMTMLAALIAGGVVAMSSTALVVKQLDEQLELHTLHGMNAVGILLFQDLAVIPFLILIVSLSGNANATLTSIFIWAILKGVFAIAAIFMIGRWIMRPLFHLIAATRVVELFTLTVLLITLFSAWLTNKLGLSYALGAFLGGMMLGETEFRHQIEIEIRPFRDVLLGLFFITIGMLADMHHWLFAWNWIALLLFAIIFGKFVLVTFISRLTGHSLSTSLRTGLVLAQGGEFGFAMLTLALSYQMLPMDYAQVILAALLISMAVAPILITYNKQIAGWFMPGKIKPQDDVIQTKLSQLTRGLQQHVIICGYGRVGQQIAKIIEQANIPYIGLDVNPELIRLASLGGEKVCFGDASHPGILRAAGLDRAKAVVISFDALKPAIRVLSIVRQTHPTLPILVRCKDQDELEALKKYHPTKIIAETFEESVTMAEHLLEILKLPLTIIDSLKAQARSKDYEILRKVFSDSLSNEYIDGDLPQKILLPVLLPPEAFAVGRQLGIFNLSAFNVEVAAIRRGAAKKMEPHVDVVLQSQDIVILYGYPEDVEKAENALLEGM